MRRARTEEYRSFVKRIYAEEVRKRIAHGREKDLGSTIFRLKKIPLHVDKEFLKEKRRDDVAFRVRKHREKVVERPYIFWEREGGRLLPPDEAVFLKRGEYNEYVDFVLSRIEWESQLGAAYEWKGKTLEPEWVLQIALDEAVESVLNLLKPTSLPENFGERKWRRFTGEAKRELAKQEVEQIRKRLEVKMVKWKREAERAKYQTS
jgi:hypothetical protein